MSTGNSNFVILAVIENIRLSGGKFVCESASQGIFLRNTVYHWFTFQKQEPLCVLLMYVPIWLNAHLLEGVGTSVHAHEGQRRAAGVVLYHSPLLVLLQQRLTSELDAHDFSGRLAASLSDPPVSSFWNWACRCLWEHLACYMGAGLLTPVLMITEQMILTAELFLQPSSPVFVSSLNIDYLFVCVYMP